MPSTRLSEMDWFWHFMLCGVAPTESLLCEFAQFQSLESY
jgi:hypothetical protein